MVPTTIVVLAHLKLIPKDAEGEAVTVPIQFAVFPTSAEAIDSGAMTASVGRLFPGECSAIATRASVQLQIVSGDDLEKQARHALEMS